MDRTTDPITLGPLLIYITFAFNYYAPKWCGGKIRHKRTGSGNDKVRLSGGHRFDKAAIHEISVNELKSSGRFGVDTHIPVPVGGYGS